jgi:hypothetical protein
MAARVVELIDVQDYAGTQVLNTLHYVDPAGTGDPAQLVNDYIAHVVPLLITAQHPVIRHTMIRHRVIYPTVDLMLESSITPAAVGTAAGDALPSFSAMSIKHVLGAGTVVLQGGFTGHIRRGGVRWGGISENDFTGNGVPAGTIAGWAAIMAEVRNPGEGAFELAVVSFLDGSRTRRAAAQAYALVTANSDPSPSTQNTRKVLRGRSF